MVFKAVVNNRGDIKKMWSSNQGYYIRSSKIINVDGSMHYFYKSRRLTYWESLKPKEVREKAS